MSKLSDKDKVRIILERIFGYYILPYRDFSEMPRGLKVLDVHPDYHSPTALWDDFLDCWQIRDIADPTPFDPLHNMDDAQIVIEAPLFMQENDEYFVSWRSETEQVKTYTCTLHLFEPRDEDGYLLSIFSANGSTPMEARCLAALAALGIEVGTE